MNDEERKEFGEYLKRLRLDKRLSLRQVEKETGISNSYLYQIERGERNAPKLDFLKKLAATYQVTLATLLAAARLQEPEDDDLYYRSINNAFDLVRRDPNYQYGTHLNADSIPIEVKRFVVEMYEESTNTQILRESVRALKGTEADGTSEK